MPEAKYYREASGRLTFGVFRFPAKGYHDTCGTIAAAFKLAQENTLVTNGFDIAFQDYRRGEQVIGLEWDNWSGFTVVAKTTQSESLVQEIGAWLLEHFEMSFGAD
jgi:hypothetical protein